MVVGDDIPVAVVGGVVDQVDDLTLLWFEQRVRRQLAGVEARAQRRDPHRQRERNPAPKPRFEASERVLGTNERVPTLLYNGYGEFVADLYKDLPDERLYM